MKTVSLQITYRKGKPFAAYIDQTDAATEKIAQRSFFFRIDVGFREFVQP